MLMKPSAHRNAWYGAIMRWAEPSRDGTPRPEKYSVASQTDSASPASNSDVSMYWPRPERARQCSAARMPLSAKSPAPRSVTGCPP